jgi:hypothetical protein
VLLVDGVCTLLNVVIANPTQVDLMLCAALSRGVATIVVTQAKNGLYYDQFLSNMFFTLDIEVFRCLHQKANEFFHGCTNMAWGAKDIGSPPLLVL